MGGRRRYVLLLICLALAVAGAVVERPVHLPDSFFDGSEQPFTALVEEVRDGPRGQRIVAEVSAGAVPTFRALLYATDITAPLSVGDVFTARAVFCRSGRFDAVPYLWIRGLSERALRVSAIALVNPGNIVVQGFVPSWRSRFAALRENLALRIYQSELSPEAASLLVASCLGTSDAPVDVKERFRSSGLAHLLCVSGFHVALVAALCSFLLRPLRLVRHGWVWSYILVIVAVWVYAAITGLQPSALRAAVMLSCFLVARVLQRGSSSTYSLVLAVIIILIINPYCIYSPGFLLSVSSVAGLLFFAGRLNPVPASCGSVRRVVGLFTVPLAAMLGSAPVLLALFHKLPLLTIPVNAFAALCFPVFMCAGCACVLLDALGIPCVFLATCVDWLEDTLMRVCDFGAGFEIGNIYLSPLALSALLSAVLALGAFLVLRRRIYKAMAAVVSAGMFVLCACAGDRSPVHRLLIDGSVYSTGIYIVSGDSAVVYTSGRPDAAMKFHSDFFAACGFDTDDIPVYPFPKDGRINCGGHRIVYAVKDLLPDETASGADYLIIGKEYKGDYAALLGALSPCRAVLTASIPAARLPELKAALSAAAVPYTMLPESVVYESQR